MKINKTLLTVTIAVTLLLLSCDPNTQTFRHTYDCEKPADIPDTLSNGKAVHWDCNWNMDYNAGKVKVIYNDDGSARAIYRELDSTWKHWDNDGSGKSK